MGGALSSRTSSLTLPSFSDDRKVIHPKSRGGPSSSLIPAQVWMRPRSQGSPASCLLPGTSWRGLLQRLCLPARPGCELGGHPGLVLWAWVPGRWHCPFPRQRGLLCDRSLMAQKGKGQHEALESRIPGHSDTILHVLMGPDTHSSGLPAPPCPRFFIGRPSLGGLTSASAVHSETGWLHPARSRPGRGSQRPHSAFGFSFPILRPEPGKETRQCEMCVGRLPG